MSDELTRAECHVVEQLATNITRCIRPGSSDRYHTLEESSGERVGHKIQRRTIASLEAKGFIRYNDGYYHLTVAGFKARTTAKANR